MKIIEKINQKNLTWNMPADIVLTGAKRISPEITVFWL
jgi:hypothetical protein